MHVYGWLCNILETMIQHLLRYTGKASIYLSEISEVCQESRAPKFRRKVAARNVGGLHEIKWQNRVWHFVGVSHSCDVR